MISLANPDKILLDFESAAINEFTAAYPDARILGCYFYLTQSDDNLRIAVRCLSALAMVPSTDVAETFRIRTS